MTRNPIYKDTVYTSSGSTLNYRIESPQGTEILKGVASERPDGTPIEIYINRLCEPFLSQSVNVEEGIITTDPDAVRTFYLYNDLNDVLLEAYVFIRAYSGEWDGSNKILNDPIRPNVSHNMLLPFSAYLATGGDMPITPTSAATDCGYYLEFDRYVINVGADVDETERYFIYITDTNIPYQTFPQGKLTGGGGVLSEFYNNDGVVKEYIGSDGNNKCLRDTTNKNGGAYYLLTKNTTGRARIFRNDFIVTTPLCSQRKLLCTIIINQSA